MATEAVIHQHECAVPDAAHLMNTCRSAGLHSNSMLSDSLKLATDNPAENCDGKPDEVSNVHRRKIASLHIVTIRFLTLDSVVRSPVPLEHCAISCTYGSTG